MAIRPSVKRGGQVLIDAMKTTAWDNDLETFKKILRAWDVITESDQERACLEAWTLKRDELERLRRSGPRGSAR